MKYTLQIAFSKSVGDILLRICEYAKKFGSSSAGNINPLLFEFSDDNVVEVKRPEKNCPIADSVILAMELYSNIPLRWMASNSSQFLNEGRDVEEFFEREFSKKIIEENDVDPEMHLVFYAPLYEEDISKRVGYILNNLPKNHKFIANIIGITYDMAWACGELKTIISKEEYSQIMLSNIKDLSDFTKPQEGNLCTILKHIFLFQNYNASGWSLNFSTEKFIDLCANLSLCLVEHYDIICRHSWRDFAWNDANECRNRPIYAINLRSRVIDIYLAINYIFRQLFTSEAETNIVCEDAIDADKVRNVYKNILEYEIELIREYKNHFSSGIEEQEVYDAFFAENVKDLFKKFIADIINDKQLNASEQQYLYSLFYQVTENTDFDDHSFDESTWLLEDMILRELNVDEGCDLMNAYNRLKECSKEITDIKDYMAEEEAMIEDLKTRLDETEEYQGELTEEGFKIGEEIFKPYHVQNVPLDVTYEIPAGQITPSSVDLRKYFSEIRNQGGQGACSAFSLVSVIEYYIHKIFKNHIALSESFAYYNGREIRNETEVDKGVTFSDVINGVMNLGVCLRELCPYDENIYNERPSDEAYVEAESRKITEAKNVNVSVDDMRSAIAQGFPVVISARAFQEYVVNHDGVIIPPDNLEDTDSYHAVVICGYSDVQGYFLLRNSWGTGKGKGVGGSGYYLLPYECVRMPGLIDCAYAVTGMNIDGFDKDDLPEFDSILNGISTNAQYAICQNMLREKELQLKQHKEHLVDLQKEYLALFNQIADYSDVELTLRELKEQTDEQREQLEDQLMSIVDQFERKNPKKGFFAKLFGKLGKNNSYEEQRKQIEEELASLDHYADDVKRDYRIKFALINGFRTINGELFQEGVRRLDISNFLYEENSDVLNRNKIDAEGYALLKKILPLDSIVEKLRQSGISTVFSEFCNTLMRIRNGEIGLYEFFSDIQSQIINAISREFDIHISDYLLEGTYESFCREINKSVVMAQLCGGVPVGYGDETKYFFCDVESIPQCVVRETENVTLLRIKDNLRMCFLQMEKYDVGDLKIFNEAIELQKKEY